MLEFRNRRAPGWDKWVKFGGRMLFVVVFGVPGVGGFIMVGKMLREYGNCVALF